MQVIDISTPEEAQQAIVSAVADLVRPHTLRLNFQARSSMIHRLVVRWMSTYVGALAGEAAGRHAAQGMIVNRVWALTSGGAS